MSSVAGENEDLCGLRGGTLGTDVEDPVGVFPGTGVVVPEGGHMNIGWVRSVLLQSTSIRCRSCKKKSCVNANFILPRRRGTYVDDIFPIENLVHAIPL